MLPTYKTLEGCEQESVCGFSLSQNGDEKDCLEFKNWKGDTTQVLVGPWEKRDSSSYFASDRNINQM